MDHNESWISDMGLPGPDAGRGGKHLIVLCDLKRRRQMGDPIRTLEISPDLQLENATPVPPTANRILLLHQPSTQATVFLV